MPGPVTPYIPLMPIIGAPMSPKPEAVAVIASRLVVNFILVKKLNCLQRATKPTLFISNFCLDLLRTRNQNYFIKIFIKPDPRGFGVLGFWPFWPSKWP